MGPVPFQVCCPGLAQSLRRAMFLLEDGLQKDGFHLIFPGPLAPSTDLIYHVHPIKCGSVEEQMTPPFPRSQFLNRQIIGQAETHTPQRMP